MGNYVKKGNTIESLMESLETIRKSMVVDRVVKEKPIQVTIRRDANGRLGPWNYTSPVDAKVEKRGASFQSFKDSLDSLVKEETLTTKDEFITILCHLSSEELKTWDGKIKSKWVSISPEETYEISDNGTMKFDVVSLELTETEYAYMMDTGFAFRKDDRLYPLSQAALPAVGRFLDAEGAFKKWDAPKAGSILLLADKMGYHDDMLILARKTESERVFQVVNLCGGKYEYIPQYDFFRSVFDQAARIGVYQMVSWSISDCTEADLRFQFQNRGLDVRCSDSNEGMSVTAYVLVGGRKISVHKNKVYHRKGASDYSHICDGVEDAYKRFDEEYAALAEIGDIKGWEKYLSGIRKIVGGKRYNSIVNGLEKEAPMNGADFFRLMLELTELPSGQSKANQVWEERRNVLSKLSKERKRREVVDYGRKLA